MSAQHTPGRLIGADENGRFKSDHEWSASHESATFATAAPLWLGDEVAALVVHASNSFALDVVDQRARRLVACWNLLQPFTTEQIEAFQADVLALAAQRDELLAALKLVVLSVKVGPPEYDLNDTLEIAEEAIAKATGQKGDAA